MHHEYAKSKCKHNHKVPGVGLAAVREGEEAKDVDSSKFLTASKSILSVWRREEFSFCKLAASGNVSSENMKLLGVKLIYDGL